MKHSTFTFFSIFAFSLALNVGALGQHRPLTPSKQDVQKLKSAFSIPQPVAANTPTAFKAPARTAAGIAPQQNLAATVSKPGKEEAYNWTNGAWKLLATNTYTYDTKGNVTEDTYKSELAPLQAKTLYTYNAQNQVTREIAQAWENNAWVNSTQEITTYNAHGDETEFVVQAFENGAWVNQSRDAYTYTGQNLQAEHLSQEWQGGAWANRERSTTTYNAQGEVTNITTQEFKNNLWVNVAREVNTYDALGNLTEEVGEVWENGSWYRTEGYKTNYGFSGNTITEVAEQEWDEEAQAWMNTTKTLITYTNGRISEYIEQEWEEGTWVNTEKYIDLVFQDYNNFILKSSVQQKWENNAWVNQFRQTNTFAPGSFLATTTLMEVYSNNAWTNANLTTITIDEKGVLTNYKNQLWAGTGWTTIQEINNIYTYDGIHLTEVVTQQSDMVVQVLQNVVRIVYSDHQTFTITGLNDPVLAANTKVYPNPASRELHVELTEADARIAEVAMFNLTGQKVKSYTIPQGFATNLTLDVEALPKGIYVLRLTTTDNRSVSRKVVRQ